MKYSSIQPNDVCENVDDGKRDTSIEKFKTFRKRGMNEDANYLASYKSKKSKFVRWFYNIRNWNISACSNTLESLLNTKSLSRGIIGGATPSSSSTRKKDRGGVQPGMV